MDPLFLIGLLVGVCLGSGATVLIFGMCWPGPAEDALFEERIEGARRMRYDDA